jgi:fatty acid synthase
MGVKVIVSTRNTATLAETNRLISDTRDQLGPIGGIFHLAVVLHDCLFESQTADNFKESAATKYWGTKNLDAATRRLCGNELKWSVSLKELTNVTCFFLISGLSCSRR